MTFDEHTTPHTDTATPSGESELKFGVSVDDLVESEAWTEKDAATDAALQAAIASNPNKEAFDYARFAELYWKKDAHKDIDGSEPASVQKAFLLDYYLLFPDVTTIEEYARKLETLDASAGN
ncbi:MAG: hypothetical protein WAO28_00980 [Candidatus Microsaccharimonas sp.]